MEGCATARGQVGNGWRMAGDARKRGYGALPRARRAKGSQIEGRGRWGAPWRADKKKPGEAGRWADYVGAGWSGGLAKGITLRANLPVATFSAAVAAAAFLPAAPLCA